MAAGNPAEAGLTWKVSSAAVVPLVNEASA